jgi:hypothetical protein
MGGSTGCDGAVQLNPGLVTTDAIADLSTNAGDLYWRGGRLSAAPPVNYMTLYLVTQLLHWNAVGGRHGCEIHDLRTQSFSSQP